MHFVYLLENLKDKGWYIGYTTNIKRRILEHNSKIGGKYTSKKTEWKIIYFECYLNKIDALGRETFLKSGSGHRFIKKQLKNYLSNKPT